MAHTFELTFANGYAMWNFIYKVNNIDTWEKFDIWWRSNVLLVSNAFKAGVLRE